MIMFNILPFHILDFHVEILLGLAPKGKPRYLKGRESHLQNAALVIPTIKSTKHCI
jgi:hypothetical protein